VIEPLTASEVKNVTTAVQRLVRAGARIEKARK
jgi:hypothetical protein